MTDPEHGQGPSHVGAPVGMSSDHAASGGVQNGQSSAGSARNAAPGKRDADGRDDGPGNAYLSSEQSKDGHSPRKRKRRRRGRKAKARVADVAAVGPDAAAPVEVDHADDADGKARAHHGGKPRRKKRRALQGRPLTCGQSPPADGVSKADAASQPPPSRGKSHSGHSVGSKDAAPSGERGRANGRRHGASPLYAALDLGTNNCRLLIAQPTRPGQFRVVDAFSRIVRLGEGLVGSGRLSQGAMDRAVEALKVCAGKLESRPIRNRRLIATEACRKAVNGMEFIERVQNEAGLELEIVDRETEARLAVSGCASLVDHSARSVVLFDIGGGSSEIAVIDLEPGRTHRLASRIKAWTSLPVGVVTLSEQHGGRDVTPEVFEAMVRDVESLLASFDCPQTLTGHHGPDSPAFHLLGTSGTVTTLAGVYLDLPRYDRRRVDGLWLSDDDVDRMMQRLLSWDFDQRSANPCIGADRADLVLAGCAILEAIRRRWPSERMRVADRGLREGLLTEMMAADGVWRRKRRGWRGMARMGAS